MTRPDVQAVLAPLKGFQRKSVDHAFERLFLAPGSSHRFLVADEVGLGKTLVARGIIAKTIDHLWDDVQRIDVIYICSNASIARQNLEKLRVSGTGQRSFALATRLTLLATELASTKDESLRHSRVNFVSFTPGTSFNLGYSTGQRQEREVLFHLLLPIIGRWKPLANLLQAGVRDRDSWRSGLENEPVAIEPGIRAKFTERLAAESQLKDDILQALDDWFFRCQKPWPAEAKQLRNDVLGRLRRLLASVCVGALEPDLVILDEFQRFKNLLETRDEQRDPAAELAQALFSATTPEGTPVRTLLLSATPYKLYTANAEIDHEDHYVDFLATTRFLMGGNEARVRQLKNNLSEFGQALKRAAAGGTADVQKTRRAVEQSLRTVMSRTERVSASDHRDAMVEESRMHMTVEAGDVHQYLAADALFTAVGDRDPMAFWKSAPYLAHFMQRYKFNDRLEDTLATEQEKVVDVLQRHGAAFLQADTLKAYGKIDPHNAKLRELLDGVLDGGLWRLLWMPPTVPYWPLEGAYAGQEAQTKSLLFSAWNVVPDVVSAVVSYEVERRMVGGRLTGYEGPARQQRPLLRLAEAADGQRSSHRLLLLLLPCLTLADAVHPLKAPSGTDRRAWVREQVDVLLASLSGDREGEIDLRWEWALPVLLDPGLRGFLEKWKQGQVEHDGKGQEQEEDRHHPNPTHFKDYLADLLTLDVTKLGKQPPGLAELATELALGAPSVLAARMLAATGIDDVERRRLAVDVALAFWSLFNRPNIITLLRGLQTEETPYWRAVLRYCQHGNLQAVLDESWHLAWEQHAWSGEQPQVETAASATRQIADSVRPPNSRVHARFLKPGADGSVTRDEVRIRTDLALRFGEARADLGGVTTTQDGVRAAFNSPFRPFILASTSIGQEGLDFHPWCHRLVHWNLPGNPVDLEQREGRVHRYKGHAVRRNVADSFAEQALKSWTMGADPWALMFEAANRAARQRGESDLVPYWLAPGKWRVQRRVPLLPWTREIEAFARLKRQLAAYRVVFGQPRQEELLNLLERAAIGTDEMREWIVDLRPRRDGGYS